MIGTVVVGERNQREALLSYLRPQVHLGQELEHRGVGSAAGIGEKLGLCQTKVRAPKGKDDDWTDVVCPCLFRK
jgi:hypothetical protein